MKAYFKLTLVAVCFALMCGRLEAGVISLLADRNTKDDVLHDDSHGFLIPVAPNGKDPLGNDVPGRIGTVVAVGDIAFGIAKLDSVNNDNSIEGRAYVVYSAQISSFGTNSGGSKVVSHQVTPATTTIGTDTFDTSAYTLDNLLGQTPGTFGNSIAVLLEWNGSGSNPFADDTAYPFEGSGGNFATVSPGQMIANLQTLAGNSSILFGVGILNSGDQFQMTLNPPLGPHSVDARFSITYIDGALNLNDFKELLSDSSFFSKASPQLEQGSETYAEVKFVLDNGTEIEEIVIQTNDDGNYRVNYVPEPASMIGLVSLAVAGAGLGLTRRRKS